MDPVTAALNVAQAAIELLTKMYDGMTPEQRVTFNQPLVDGLKRWNDFANTVAALMKAQ